MSTIEISYGNYHAAPPNNWREVDEETFVRYAMRAHYGPKRIEYRSVPIEMQYPGAAAPRVENQGMHLQWYHNGKGDAIYLDYWAKRVRFFLFAECEHTMRHTANLGRCYNEYTCTKCGYVETIDSSD